MLALRARRAGACRATGAPAGPWGRVLAARPLHATPAPRIWPLVAGIGVATAAYAVRLALNAAREQEAAERRGESARDDAEGSSASSSTHAASASAAASAQAAAAASAATGGGGGVLAPVLAISVGDSGLRLALASAGAAGARVIETPEGARAFPAAYMVARDGEVVVGAAALRRRFESGAAVATDATMRLGARMASGDGAEEGAAGGAAEAADPWASAFGAGRAPLVAAPDGSLAYRLHSAVRTPAHAVAAVLGHAKGVAEEAAGRKLWRAVLAVRAGADDTHVDAARAAAAECGLLGAAVVPAPVAALEAARAAAGDGGGGAASAADGVAVVYHMGARRASATVLSATGAEPPRVLAVAETTAAGGDRYDRSVVDWLVGAFSQEHGEGIELRADPLALSRLLDAASKARHELSSAPATVVELPFITADASGPKHLRAELSRAAFESLVADGLTEAAVAETVPRALAAAGVDAAAVRVLVLSGGLLRTPHVRARVSAALPAARVLPAGADAAAVSPEELSVLGAALPRFAPRAATAAEASQAA